MSPFAEAGLLTRARHTRRVSAQTPLVRSASASARTLRSRTLMEGRCRPPAELSADESVLSQPSPLTGPVAACSSGSTTEDGAGNGAAHEVHEIMQRIVALAPQLTFEELLKVNKVFSDLVHVRAQAGNRKQESSREAESPLRPQHLDYSPDGPHAGSGGSEPAQDGAESDAGSVGSVCRPCSDDGDARSTSASSDASEPAQWVPGAGGVESVGPLLIDEPGAAEAAHFAFSMEGAEALASAAADGGGGHEAVEGTVVAAEEELPSQRVRGGKRRGGRRWRRGNGGGGGGFGPSEYDLAHGRNLHCDKCDLSESGANCMADEMMDRRTIRETVEAFDEKRGLRGGGRLERHNREARHTLYKGVVAWRFADPLGAENRVRLPQCVNVKIRESFPNPRCSREHGCDFYAGCEARGHYVGFRTAAESRAEREGRFIDLVSDQMPGGVAAAEKPMAEAAEAEAAAEAEVVGAEAGAEEPMVGAAGAERLADADEPMVEEETAAAKEQRSPHRSGRRKGRRTGQVVGSPQAGSPDGHAGPPGGGPDSAQANRSERRRQKAAQRRPAVRTTRGNILIGRNVCPRGHNLELPVDLSSAMKCDVCDHAIASAAPRYACVECDYDVCHTCAIGR